MMQEQSFTQPQIRPLNEYKKLQRLIDDKESKEEIYQKMMQRETKVLDVINRVVEYETKKREDTNISVMMLELIHEFVRIWIIMIQEVMVLDMNNIKAKQVFDIFLRNDRKIYLGTMLVLIVCILFFIDIST